MQVRLSQDDPFSIEVPLLALTVFEDDPELGEQVARADALLDGGFSRAREAGDFRGKEGEDALFYAPEGQEQGPARLLFVGAGSRSEGGAERVRKLVARSVRKAESLSLTRLALHVGADLGDVLEVAKAAAEGGALAAWDFRELKSTPPEADASGVAGNSREASERPKPLVGELVLSVGGNPQEAARGVRIGTAFADGERLARDLQWWPGNFATPSHLADVALGLADEYGFVSRILGPVELIAEGMEAILAVSAGSDEEPRLIVLEHRGGDEDSPVLALVGNGLTFDAGGISIKPAAGMEEYEVRHVWGCSRARGDEGYRRTQTPSERGRRRPRVRESSLGCGNQARRCHPDPCGKDG